MVAPNDKSNSALFAAGVMETIYDNGPVPIDALPAFIAIGGFTFDEASHGLALSEASGLLHAVDEYGVACDPRDGSFVVLTDFGRETVEACRLADARDAAGGDPNYN